MFRWYGNMDGCMYTCCVHVIKECSVTLLFLPLVSRVLSYHFCSVASRYGWKAAKRFAMKSGYCVVSSFRLVGPLRLAGRFSSSSPSSSFSPSSLSTSSSSSDLLLDRWTQIEKRTGIRNKFEQCSDVVRDTWCLVPRSSPARRLWSQGSDTAAGPAALIKISVELSELYDLLKTEIHSIINAHGECFTEKSHHPNLVRVQLVTNNLLIIFL